MGIFQSRSSEHTDSESNLRTMSDVDLILEVQWRLHSPNTEVRTLWRKWLLTMSLEAQRQNWHAEQSESVTQSDALLPLHHPSDAKTMAQQWMVVNQDKLEIFDWVSWVGGRDQPRIFKSYQEASRVDGRSADWFCTEYRGVDPREFEL
jgi:hypothetical protein